jgi:hypothetical protein
MERLTQDNATHAETLAGTARALAAQAEELQATVGEFTLSRTADSRQPTAVIRCRTEAATTPAGRLAA